MIKTQLRMVNGRKERKHGSGQEITMDPITRRISTVEARTRFLRFFYSLKMPKLKQVSILQTALMETDLLLLMVVRKQSVLHTMRVHCSFITLLGPIMLW